MRFNSPLLAISLVLPSQVSALAIPGLAIPGLSDLLPAPAKRTGPVIDLGYVKYQGTQNTAVSTNTYYGIRYAAPPIGNNRWKAPLPIEQYGGYSPSTVMDATTQGPGCFQSVPSWAGYTLGTGAAAPGYGLVRHSKGNLIFVSIQYRLHGFGFLSGSEIKKAGTANAGLLDQRAALDWVQRNIAKFGGDPKKVTVAGASAGGGSVTAQMIMYGGVSNPPFRAAIAEYPWWQSYHNDTVLEAQYQQLLTTSKCSNLQCLRSLPEVDLANAIQRTFNLGYVAGLYGYGDFYYGPSVDGTIIKELPSSAAASGRITKVPLLTNRDENEGINFSNGSITTTAETTSDLQRVWPLATPAFFNSLASLYPVSSYSTSLLRRAAIFGDALIDCATTQLATSLMKAGQPVWKMRFNAGNTVHGATIPYLYGVSANGADSANNQTLANIMKDYFVSFATQLDPNAVSYSGVSKPTWNKYSTKPQVMGVTNTLLANIPDYDAGAKCNFFQQNGAIIRS
ncbi:hypothetical protein BP6252_03953 [Coleophoma cylindrospora]|uniref:Carboxylic ester hydrolase n=1 Tax=Coleophoma cylindrospora TaxID=1849047 RepID=A0A3D8S9N1_9HELO|nr:hypothetical protein BP6252_03953 [Coleophoma cylindrospora]